MNGMRLRRGLDTIQAAVFLVMLHWTFRFRGQRRVARLTRNAMRVTAEQQAGLDERGVDAWQTARAVWRAKRLLPFHSTCLQTALATQTLFASKGVSSTVRIGVANPNVEAHAWVEVGDFVLDDQRLSHRFAPFEAPGAPPAEAPG